MVRSDHVLECSSCGTEYDPQDHTWVVSFRPEQFVKFEAQSHRTVVTPGEFELTRLLKYGLTVTNKLVCVALIFGNSKVKMWSPTFRRDSEKEWLRKNLESVYTLATREDKNG